MFKKLIFIFCFALTACGLETYQSGDLPAIKRLESIKKGDSKEKVERVLGVPNFASTPAEGTEDLYIYAQTKKSSRIFFNPDIVEQDVYVFVFDKNQNVKRTAHLDMQDIQDVAYESEITDIGGEKLSVWEQLADNFGKYNAGGQDSTVRR
jgi:outer membrane protein assembly factor BamE (lipoprotein component of BamABCDE complex)